MNVEKLKQLKKDAGYTNQMISDESGVPLGTVQKVFSGETKAPRHKTLKAIEGILKSASGYEDELIMASNSTQNIHSPNNMKQSEIPSDIKPDDHPEKNMLSELMAGEIIFAIRKYMDENGMTGYLAGPLTKVKIAGDDREAVNVYPQISFVRDPDMIEHDGIVGAPELVIEIMDGVTKNMQMGAKPDMYRNAGVKEYWMIDVTSKNITVHEFDREVFPSIYGFSGRVPVKTISDDCEINFALMYSKVGFLF